MIFMNGLSNFGMIIIVVYLGIDSLSILFHNHTV